MTTNRDLESLIDIDYHGRNIIAFVSGMTQTEFATDQKTIAAVMCAIAVMGEATKRLSNEFREQHPQLPWRELTGLRDRLVHVTEISIWTYCRMWFRLKFQHCW
jgi:uncharacterized protein with HEPN domain